MEVQKPKESEEEEKKCPVCNQPYSYIEKRIREGKYSTGVYYYAVHTKGLPEGKKVKKCYLGSGAYYYVEKFQDLDLSGYIDEERYLRYAINILDKLNGEELQKLDGKLVMNFVLNIISKLDKESVTKIFQASAKRLKELKTSEPKQ
jgi:hypothetical protein